MYVILAAAGMLGTASAHIASFTKPTTQRTVRATSLKMIAPQQALTSQAALILNPSAVSATATSAIAMSQDQAQATAVHFASPL